MAAKKKSLTKNVPKNNRYRIGGVTASAVEDDIERRNNPSPYTAAAGNRGGTSQQALSAVPASPNWSEMSSPNDRPMTMNWSEGMDAKPLAAKQAVPMPAVATKYPGEEMPDKPVDWSRPGATPQNPRVDPTQNRVIPSRGTYDDGSQDEARAAIAHQQNMQNLGSANRFSPDYQGSSGPTFSSMPDSRQTDGFKDSSYEDMMGALSRSGLSTRFRHMAHLAGTQMGVQQRREEAGQRNALGYAGLDNQRYGYDTSAQTARVGHAITARGQDIGADTARAGHAIQARGQDFTLQGNENTNLTSRMNNADTIAGHMAIEDRRGQNQQALYGDYYPAKAESIRFGMQGVRDRVGSADKNMAALQKRLADNPNDVLAMRDMELARRERRDALAKYQAPPDYGYAIGGKVEGIPAQGYGAAPQMQDNNPRSYAAYAANMIKALGQDGAKYLVSPQDYAAMQQEGQNVMSQQLAAAKMQQHPTVQAGQLLATGGQVKQDIPAEAIPVQGQELQGVGPAAGGPTDDSIPAVIDGKKPAALSSGEFVYTTAATEAVGAPVLRAVMKGLEQGNPAVIQAMMQAAIKATAPQKPQQAVG